MLKRFGVSLEDELLLSFDTLIQSQGYANRSEAIRDLIRAALVDREWQDGAAQTAGAVVLVYDHRKRDLQARLTELQHQSHANIIATMHSHLDHNNCIEVVLLRGSAAELQEISEKLIATRGVKHGRLMATSLGSGLA